MISYKKRIANLERRISGENNKGLVVIDVVDGDMEKAKEKARLLKARRVLYIDIPNNGRNRLTS